MGTEPIGAIARLSEEFAKLPGIGPKTAERLTHYLLGQYPEATACYQQAISEYRQAGHRPGEGGTLGRLGDVQYSNGHPAAAVISWHQALDILTSLHHPDAAAIRAKLA